jgi:hypothetical protein
MSVTPHSEKLPSSKSEETFDELTYSSDNELSRSNSMLNSPNAFLVKTPFTSKRNLFQSPQARTYESDSDEEFGHTPNDVKKMEKKIELLKQILLNERKIRKEQSLKTSKALSEFESLKNMNKERVNDDYFFNKKESFD